MRRDAGVKNASVIRGLRMEPDLARKLVAHARVLAERAGVYDKQNRPAADATQATRQLLRQGLGMAAPYDDPPSESGVVWPMLTAGLRTDHALWDAVTSYCGGRKKSLGLAGCIRHLLRQALGISEAESLQRERHFATIATTRKRESEKTGSR